MFSIFPRTTKKALRKLRLLITILFCISTITVMLLPQSPLDEDDDTPYDASNALLPTSCPFDVPEVYRILIIFRVPIDLIETRNYVRAQVRNESMDCKTDAVFLFGKFRGPLAEQQHKTLHEENKLYGDVLELNIYYDYQLHDSFAVEALKPWIISNPCKIYRNIVFGFFVLPDARIERVTRLKVEQEYWAEDDCLKFAKHKVNNVKFFAHYFPPKLATSIREKPAFSGKAFLGDEDVDPENRMLYQDSIVAPHDYRYLVGGGNICTKRTGNRLSTIFAVHSAAFNFINRKLIRESWGSKAVMEEQNSLLIFFLGKNSKAKNRTMENKRLEIESTKFNDIVQEDFEDCYKNMTLKQIAVLKFLSKYCSEVSYSYVFKTDDDIVIDMKSVGHYVDTVTTQGMHLKRTILCFHLNERTLVPRNRTNKWYVSRQEYPFDMYPAYCSGAGYLIPKGLIDLMYDAALHIKTFWVDDMHISGVLPESIGDIVLLQIPKQYPIISHRHLVHHEDIRGKFIIHVKQNLELFQVFWSHFQRQHKLGVGSQV